MATTRTMWSSLLRQSKAAVATFLALLLIITNLNVAAASRGGTEVRNNPFTVGYTFKLGGVDQVCSGSLIASTIIVTAAHCVVDESGNKSSDYIFAAPGVALDAPINPSIKRPSVIKVFTVPGYKLTASNESDDIAFLQLDIPLATKGFIRVATAAEVASLIDKAAIQGYGFGDVFETNAPYSVYTRSYPILWNSAKNASNTVTISSTNSSACFGDSGGPVTTKLSNGEEVLIAAMSGAAQVINRCGTQIVGTFVMRVTVVNPYLNLVAEAIKVAPSTSPKQVVKTYKITCVKGKTKKYLTGTNPKCPSGYKQTAKVLISK